MQTEANNYFHALTRVCIHVRGTMACIAIPPTALRMPIITQFDVCRNNAVSRDSVKRDETRMRSETTCMVKKKGSKGFLTDCDFFDTIRASLKDSCSLLLPVACNMGFLPRSRAGIRVTDRCAS